MRYEKPEIVPLGTAAELILGGKLIFGFESVDPMTRRTASDSELDD
jgi:hypothetical protein